MPQIGLPFQPPRRGGRGERGDGEGDGNDGGRRVWGVTELVGAAHRRLESEFGYVWVEGEVTGLKLHRNGHAYFSLRDEKSTLPSVMWRSSLQRLRFRLEEGQRLRVNGRLGIYAASGRFQFYAERAEPAGLGAMMLELEQLKARLSAEGLFAPERKRALPRWPRRIGVVTSASGAAVHDILKVLRRRMPSRVLLAPSRVQGPDAPPELVEALRRVALQPGIDVVIIGRGGGSLEDLWAFNDEAVARAIVDCPVPVISAVGHEVDVSVADLVADVRAATPSHAAELVVQDRAAVLEQLDHLQRRLESTTRRRLGDETRRLVELQTALERAMYGRLTPARRRLDAARARLRERGVGLIRAEKRRLAELRQRLERQHPRAQLARDRRQLQALEARLQRAIRRRLAEAKVRLARAAGKLDALSPLGVLERGFSVVTDADGRPVVDAAAVRVGEALAVRLHRGQLDVKVSAVLQSESESESESESGA